MANYTNVGWADLHLGASWDTALGNFTPSFTDASVRTRGGDYIVLPVLSVTQEVWFSFVVFEVTGNPIQGLQSAILITNTADMVLLDIRANSSTVYDHVIYVQTNGSGAGALTSQGPIPWGAGRQRFDIHVVAGNGTGSITIYRNGATVGNYTGLDTGTLPIKQARLQSGGVISSVNISNRGSFWSEFIVGEDAVSSTLFLQSYSSFPRAASLIDNDWQGSFLNLIKSDNYAIDTGWMISDAVGQKSAFQITLTTPASVEREIVQVSINSRGVRPTGSALDYAHYLRINGTQATAPPTGSTALVGTRNNRWDVSPLTGLPWTFFELTGIEFGIESV